MKTNTGLAIITFLALLSLTLLVGYSVEPISSYPTHETTNSPTKPKTESANQYEVEILVNEYRSARNLKALIHNPELCVWADSRKEDVKTNLSHDKFENTISPEAFKRGYRYMGENISWGFSDEPLIVSKWDASQVHKDTMLNPLYTSTCVRCSDNFCVQLFGAK